MNRRSFLAALAAPLVCSPAKPGPVWVGMDLASGPDATAFMLYPWQRELLAYMRANPGLRLSVFPARRNGKPSFKRYAVKFSPTVYE